MTSRQYTEIYCNGPGTVLGTCGKAYNDLGNATQVRRRARLAGWSVGRPGGEDYCPDHKTKRSRAGEGASSA